SETREVMLQKLFTRLSLSHRNLSRVTNYRRSSGRKTTIMRKIKEDVMIYRLSVWTLTHWALSQLQNFIIPRENSEDRRFPKFFFFGRRKYSYGISKIHLPAVRGRKDYSCLSDLKPADLGDVGPARGGFPRDSPVPTLDVRSSVLGDGAAATGYRVVYRPSTAWK
ncbi:unnamed protein product, partial [Nesidiocoris tenuis]